MSAITAEAAGFPLPGPAQNYLQLELNHNTSPESKIALPIADTIIWIFYYNGSRS